MRLPGGAARLQKLRTQLWHLRHGGRAQLRTYRIRTNAERGVVRLENARGAEGGWTGRGHRRRLLFADAELPAVPARRSDVTVGVILDEFSALGFQYEWNTMPLRRSSWKEQLRDQGIDLLFVESAWAGNGGDWKYQLTGTSGPKPDFVELLRWCREQGIPTVFWNKEDPPHYDDFLPAARLFDHVFTSDSNMIESYRRDLGHDRVSSLSFAAQPVLHSPVRPTRGWHRRDVAFAGMYFAHKYPERRAQMELLLGGAGDASAGMELGLEVFSRQLQGNPEYQFPSPLAERVVGSLSYRQMLTAYKAYKVFLNVNSVVDSPSMCARRIFEISASGTPVVSTPSRALEDLFPPDEVAVAASREQARDTVRSLVEHSMLAERQAHRAQRRIWAEHTYAHRAEQVLLAAVPERADPVALPSLSVLLSTNRPNQLEHVFRTVSSQRGVTPELILLTHGFTAEKSALAELRDKYPLESVTVLRAGTEKSLGDCLNACVGAASGTVATKMDDDDFYGENYLLDQVNSLSFSRAEVVGKQAHYMYLRNYNATLLRFAHREHRFTNMLMGPTLMAALSTFREFPFESLTKGEDTAFLRAVTAASGRLYSADRFNYYQQRNGAGHTWQATDQSLLSTGEIQFFGPPNNHVSI
ncbi:glycosyltransferase [Arthrobacter crusticola]|uniref:Glycosyltransferase n=1 Tax=Arthrobacter crusticola TaxID=2547960 RepID=A0A4R5U265_9MICC|nr:glycosyltransferase [Arthrobacter crusticola]TDK27726.1 glycosyltransferase [Arthrobacter crusticola]